MSDDDFPRPSKARIAESQEIVRGDRRKMRRAVIRVIDAIAETEARRDIEHISGKQCWIDQL